MEIKDRIKALREALKKDQKDFAKELSTIPQTISKYERGEIKPSFEILAKIAEIHNVNINWLLTEQGTMFQNEEVKKIENGEAKILEAYKKLPEERKEYYYYKIIAESLDH